MDAPEDSTPPSPTGLMRLISPWEYRHLPVAIALRFAGGGFQLGVGLVLVSLGNKAGTGEERRTCYRWAAWFLTFAGLNFSGGLLELAATRTARPRT
jgi:hypothetical protein